MSKSYFSLYIQVEVIVFKKVIEKRELKNNQNNIILLPLHPLLLYAYSKKRFLKKIILIKKCFIFLEILVDQINGERRSLSLSTRMFSCSSRFASLFTPFFVRSFSPMSARWMLTRSFGYPFAFLVIRLLDLSLARSLRFRFVQFFLRLPTYSWA